MPSMKGKHKQRKCARGVLDDILAGFSSFGAHRKLISLAFFERSQFDGRRRDGF